MIMPTPRSSVERERTPGDTGSGMNAWYFSVNKGGVHSLTLFQFFPFLPDSGQYKNTREFFQYPYPIIVHAIIRGSLSIIDISLFYLLACLSACYDSLPLKFQGTLPD